jgi:hypothetical protein
LGWLKRVAAGGASEYAARVTGKPSDEFSV